MKFAATLKQISVFCTQRAKLGLFGLAVIAGGLQGASSAQAADSYWKQVQDRGALRCAAAISPPYVMKDLKTGEYGGAYLDLCKEFAEVLGVKIEFVDTTWDNIVAGLQAGKWDLSPALNRTSKRALAIGYSTIAGYDAMNFAYMSANPKLKEPKADLTSFDQADIRIGVMSGTAQDQKVTGRFTKAQIVRIPDANAVNLALLSGRIDVAAADSTTNMLLHVAHQDKVSLLESEPPLMRQGISFGMPRDLSPADRDVFNIFVEEKVALGEVEKDLEHWGQVYLQGAK